MFGDAPVLTGPSIDLSGVAAAGHTHVEGDVTSLVTHLAGKASSSHTHAEADVTSLVTDLAGKAAASHTHAEADVTNLIADLSAKAASTHIHAPRMGLETGQETFSRELAGSSAISVTSGSLRLTYFEARKAEAITQVRVTSGTTAAAATPTLVRFGLYSIASNGDGTLVASTPNDTVLLAATSTSYTKALSASFTPTVGALYAFGILVVTAAATPTFCGYSMATALDAESTLAPRLTSRINSLSDLPSSFVAASLTTTNSRFYAALLPS